MNRKHNAQSKYYRAETERMIFHPKVLQVPAHHRSYVGSVVTVTGWMLGWKTSPEVRITVVQKLGSDYIRQEDVFEPQWFARVAEFPDEIIPERNLRPCKESY